MTDDDLHALRALAGPRTATTPTDLARLRHRVVTGNRGESRASPRRWLVPLAAATLALVVIGGVGALLRGGPAAGPAAPPLPPMLQLGAPVDVAAAFADLERAAATARPLTPAGGQLLYLRTDMLVPTGGPDHYDLVPQVNEAWFEPEGMIRVREEDDGKPVTGPKGESQAETAAGERDLLRRLGPGPARPTPVWLNGLSSDPATLRAQLGPEEQPWATTTLLLIEADPLLPIGVKAAVLKLMSTASDVHATGAWLGGRRVLALWQGTHRQADMLLLDPADARLVGHVMVDTGTGPGPTPKPGQSPTPGTGIPQVLQQWVYTYRLVS